MTVVVTVNVEARYRGFLASAMLEIAPGGVHLAADDQRYKGKNLGRRLPVVLRVGAGIDSDDLAGPVRRGRTANPYLGRGTQGNR